MIPSDELKALDKSHKDYVNKFTDKYAGVMIKELGYKDTKTGRDYLKKKGFV